MSTQRESDLESLAEAVRDYCAGTPARAGAADAEELAGRLTRKRALINSLELDFAGDAAAIHAVYREEVFGDVSAWAWMRSECHMTSQAISRAICVGERSPELARSCAALTAGRIGFAHPGLMAETAAAIADSATATVSFDEDRLLRKAEHLSVQRFRTQCRHLRRAADRAAFLAEQTAAREARTLSLRGYEDGGLELSGFFDAEGGALLRSALEPYLAGRPVAGEDRSREQRLADALLEVCSHALDSGVVPQRASQRAHLQVTSTLETLLDLVGGRRGSSSWATWSPAPPCSAWRAMPR